MTFLLGALVALVGITASPGDLPKSRPIHDYDSPYFARARATVLDRSAEPAKRITAMRELVIRDATSGREIIAEALKDRNARVQKEAAEWLAIYGDSRGLEWEARCVTDTACVGFRYHALRLLGNARSERYADLIRREVERVFRPGLRGETWGGSAENRAMLKYGTIALARIGRADDRDLILSVVQARPSSDFLEALGYLDDRRSHKILWAAYRSLSRTPTCSSAGLGVPALLPLSRLGDERAISELKDVLRGVGVPPGPWPEHGFPSLCADRAQAFSGLRPRDSTRFAETVIEIAAQEPEGPGTFDAWQALGVMRPEGLGSRVLKLAISRPRWRLVSHYMLKTVVLAVDPELHDEFWNAYQDVQVIPAQLGIRTQVRQGLGYLLFSGVGQWTGD
ncbi:MAG TPA: hypothetical protein VLE22_24755 [Bryobacteraceae bacterium]|nr:hypothetical protein [Bryobacteraceae bacterium]